MSERLTKLEVKNYRSLANIEIDPGSLNVLFGPNGAGKSTLLDTIWFLRDCATRGVDVAASDRSHGIGILWDGAGPGDNLSIAIETQKARYEVQFQLSSGRIDNYVGEKLTSNSRTLVVIDRPIGSDTASFYSHKLEEMVQVPLRDPDRLSLVRYMDFDPDNWEANECDKLLHFISPYRSREFDFYKIKQLGSAMGREIRVFERGQNLWSVIRNIHDKVSIDDRYQTVMEFMREAFPTFDGIVIDQSGPNSVYGEFRIDPHRELIKASGVSDGYLHMLILLTALFSEGTERGSLILFDEPDMSLHPHALTVLAKAMKVAARDWQKQILVATHSPVLMSQFESGDIWAAELDKEGRTTLKRVTEIANIQDLLEDYAVGSLYMAEAVAPQSGTSIASATG